LKQRPSHFAEVELQQKGVGLGWLLASPFEMSYTCILEIKQPNENLYEMMNFSMSSTGSSRSGKTSKSGISAETQKLVEMMMKEVFIPRLGCDLYRLFVCLFVF
jgi:hypothetical protein